MSELFEYKCPNCGGAIEFDSASQKMKCPYCDSEFDVEALKSKDAQLDSAQPDDLSWNVSAGQEWEEGEEGSMSVFVCKSCGGEIVGDENTAATSCPYCDNPVVMSGRLSGTLKPDYVIPFKFDKKAAKEQLKKYVSSKKFAPNSFKAENRLEEIKGIYVPFWLFDSKTDAQFNFKGAKVRTWSDSKYEYTETSYYNVFRKGAMAFENIPVDGSTRMADDLMESIEPFDFSTAVDFQTAYLAGYLADKYDVSMENSIDRANQRVRQTAEDVLKGTANGYNTLTTESSSVQIKEGVAKYALYPVWLLTTSFKGNSYTFAMNGQSGKFIGDLPVSKGKLAALFAGLTVGLSAAIYAFLTILG